MRKIYLILILIVMFGRVQAQQDPQYSQYMFNGQVLNPAFCGSLDRVSGTLIIREQWMGLEGRPRTQSLAFHGPSRNLNSGFGLYLVNDKIGETGNTRMGGQYAYRIKLGDNARLALGLQASLDNYRSNILDLHAQNSTDPLLAANNVNLWKGNVGTGLYLNTKSLFLGLSIPELLKNRLSEEEFSETREDRTFLGTAGLIIPMGPKVKFKPSVLAKYNPAVPVSFDFNGMFLFADKVWLGASYRTEDAVVFLADIQLTQLWRIGYAYDMTLSDLKTYSSGSHEIMLGLDLNLRREDISPRYFR